MTRTLARWLRRSVPALLAPALIPSAPAHAAPGAARDDALLGCWRSQVQVSTSADGSRATTNSGFANVDGRIVIVHVAAREAPEGRRALLAMLERLLPGDPR